MDLIRVCTAVLVALISLTGVTWALDGERESLPRISLTTSRESYSTEDRVEFEIRIDNVTDHDVCLPAAAGFGSGWYPFHAMDPSGEKVLYECIVVTRFEDAPCDIICLAPGSFYGFRYSHSPLRTSGTWSYAIGYHVPDTTGFPQILAQKLVSEPVLIEVTERYGKEPN